MSGSAPRGNEVEVEVDDEDEDDDAVDVDVDVEVGDVVESSRPSSLEPVSWTCGDGVVTGLVAPSTTAA